MTEHLGQSESSPLHPHEPGIPSALDSEGRCLVCILLVELGRYRDAAEAASKELTKQATAWITVAPVLEAHVYEDAPEWNAYTRWARGKQAHAMARELRRLVQEKA